MDLLTKIILILMPVLVVLIVFTTIARRQYKVKGKCPWCETEITGYPPGVTCPACRKRIVIRDGKFIKIE